MVRLARAAHALLTLVLATVVGAVVLVLLAAGGLAWRLHQGPLDVTPLASRVLPLVDPQLTVSHATVALAQVGGERVLRLGVMGVTRTREAEQAADTVRSATLAVALSPLLAGRVAPEEIIADGVRLHIQRGESSQSSADPDSLLARLRHVAISDVQVWVEDGALGQTWQATDASLALERRADGALAGHGAASLSSGAVSARATVDGAYSAKAAQVSLSLSPVSPAAVAQAVPQLAMLGAMESAVGLRIAASFGPDLTPVQATVHAEAGAGVLQLPAQGGGSSPAKFDSLALDLDATPTHAALRGLRLVLPSPSGAPASTLVVSGTADRADGRFQAHLAVDLDHAAFADLPALWPERVGGNSRAWLTENLTAGTVHDGHITFTLTGAETGDDIDLTEGSGSLIGEDVTAWWLRPVPPLEHGHAVLTWQNPDTMLITVSGARQGTLVANNGTVRITGLTGHDQVALINADVTGPLADLFTLLRHPRLKLLSRHPLPITAPTGTVAAHLTVQVPLEAKVTADQVTIHANGQTTNTHLGGVAAGRDLDRGALTFDVTNDGMSISGTAQLDHMPAKLAVDMDFRAGTPSQVLQHVTASLRISDRDAQAAGLAVIGLTAGTMVTGVDYSERRDGSATLGVTGDLREAGFQTPLGWSKTVGTPGHFEGQALLSKGRLVGLEGLRAEAPGLSIQGRSELVAGVPSVVHLERGEIGRSSATGTIALPQRDGDPYRITLAGPRLDLEGRLSTKDAPAASDRPAASASGPGTPYAVDLRFGQVLFGPSHSLGSVTLAARGDGRRLSMARLVTTGPERVQADLTSSGTERKLWATATDLGSLLRATDLASEINGGTLILDGAFDDRVAGSPFHGTLDLRNFQVRGAPVVGKLLQGMTLYGLVDALRGPGLAFDQLSTPFRLDGPLLDLEDARAYSSSLGVTATGRLDFGRKVVDLKGTIVPAYFFNSLPGRVPLLGRLFSPEKGSGLFAATYALRGSLLDPSVNVNPLSALTPGFTRRLFDLFD